jgi:Cdc6-like AAA superfamily ATPase
VAQTERIQPNTNPASPGDTPQEEKVCRTVILTDEPEEIDAFSGPHQRVAHAIAKLIQPKDAEGIAIGIEGSWGSGKSTVARLLTKQLSDPNIAVVPFDAWAHEGDPLRRTFLETIIKKFQYLKWVDETEWKKGADELANRREVVTTKDNLTVTTWGKVIAFTLLLVPLGGSFIGAAVREPFTFESGPLAVKVFVLLSIGLILSFCPLIVFLLKYKKNPDLLSLLFNKGVSEKTTETSKTVDPTSIEFEESFNRLLEDAIADKKDRRVVLILDNLDRVDAKDALSIWSTLQTFFQHKGSDRPDWHKRLWLLVLYDLDGLSQLWKKDGNSGNVDTAVSFIDKSFQIRFEVPRLVPSDWGQFLTTQLTKAFENHSDSDRHEVYRVLAINETKQKRLPTIRELKLFVNQIGAIHRQWAGETSDKDTFPLGQIACYVVLRRNKVNVIEKLEETDFPDKEYIDLLGNSLRENLAGLAFNIETSVAQQLLYSDKIKAALMNGKADELKQAALLLGKAFWDTFERIATTEWAVTEASKMADAALTLEESDLLTAAYKPSARSVIKAICEHAELVDTWLLLDRNKARGLAVLLKWKIELGGASTQNERFVDRLFAGVEAGLTHDVMREYIKFVAKDWLENLAIIGHDLDQNLRLRALRVVFDGLNASLHITALNEKQIDSVLEVLAELQEQPEIGLTEGKNLSELVRDGKFSKLIDIAGKGPTTTAWVVYLMSRYDPSFEILRARSVSVTDPMLEIFAGILERFGQTALLFKMVEVESSFKNLVIGTLRFVLNTSTGTDLFVGEGGVERLEFVFRELDTNEEEHARLKRLFSQLPADLNLAENLMKKSFEPAVANLYRLILEMSDEKHEGFTKWCVEGLRSVNADTWREHLDASDRLLNLAFYLSRFTELELGEQYFQGLVGTLETRSTADWPSAPVEYDNLASLIGPLESRFRYAFQDHIRKLFEESKPLPRWFFQLVGPELVAQLNSSRGSQAIDTFALMLGRKEPAGLELLDQTLETLDSSLKEKYSSTPAWANLRLVARRVLMAQRFNVGPNALATSIANFLQVKPLKNGAIIFAEFDGSKIVAISPGTTEELTIIEHPSSEYPSVGQPIWSTDGNKVAFIGTTALKRDDIFVLEEASGEIKQITIGPYSNRQPSWAPDGKTLAFTRVDGETSDIYTVDLETSKERRLTDAERAEHPSWSPDGRRIAFQWKKSEGTRNIGLMNADGSNLTFHNEGSDPSWSPDGRLIAFVMRSKESSGLYILNLDDDSPPKFVEKGRVYNPVWSPDGTKLLYQLARVLTLSFFRVMLTGMTAKPWRMAFTHRGNPY